MVYRELKSVQSVKRPLMYNICKVNKGVASVEFVQNIADSSARSIINTLMGQEKRNIRTENVSFHATFNPIHEDNMTPNEVLSFIRDFMDKRGYGKQPYAVFKHNDISRGHYHVVSIRTDSNGRAIIPRMVKNKKGEIVPYKLEKRLSYQILRDLQKKYKYRIGKAKDRERLPEIAYFKHSSGNIKKQLYHIFQTLLNVFVFSTKAQFATAMEHFGVKIRFGESKYEKGKEEIILQGMENGRVVTRCLFLSKKDIEEFNHKLKHSKASIYKSNILQTEDAFLGALSIARNENQLLKNLGKKGIDLQINRTEQGRVYGITFFDWEKFMAFKGSDVNKDIRQFLSDADFSDERKKVLENHYKDRLERILLEEKKSDFTAVYVPAINKIIGTCDTLIDINNGSGLSSLANHPSLLWGRLIMGRYERAISESDIVFIVDDINKDLPSIFIDTMAVMEQALSRINEAGDIQTKRRVRKAAEQALYEFSRAMDVFSNRIRRNPEWQNLSESIRKMRKRVDNEIKCSMIVDSPTPENIKLVGRLPGCMTDKDTYHHKQSNDVIAHNGKAVVGNAKEIFHRPSYAGNEYVSDDYFRNYAFKAEFMDGPHFVLVARRDFGRSEHDRYYISELYRDQPLDQLRWENQFGDFLLYDDIRNSIDKYNKELSERLHYYPTTNENTLSNNNGVKLKR